MQATTDLKSLAVRYIEAAGSKDYAAITPMLAPDVTFKGVAFETRGAEEFIAPFKRMAPVWVRSDIRNVFVEGDQVCVIYDFVTDTDAVSVPCIELITFRDEKITRVELFFDRVQFAPAAEALAKRPAAQ